jgi:hypothetical protein
MSKIRLRFVATKGVSSAIVRFQAGICMPFTPNHVESVSPDGTKYIGQHIDGGMQSRDAGYDAYCLLHELFVDLPCTQAQEDAYYGYLNSKLNQPYDWESILSFIDPAWNLHKFNHLICSAITVAGLRTPGCEYFPWWLTVPFHHISPRDLFLIASTHVEIAHPEMPL